jgi:hypothetical protein
MTILTNLRTWLDHVYPGLWNASVAAFAVLVLWLTKKFAPNFFAKLPPPVQALPAMFIAGLVSGIAALEPTIISFIASFIGGGLMGGVAAVGTHRTLKESPLPYGEPNKPQSIKPPSPPVTHITILFLTAMCLTGTAGCGFFQSPTGKAVTCDISAGVLAALQDLLLIPGVLLEPLEAAYSKACTQAAAKGMTQHDAEQYGLDHARTVAMKMALEYKAASK